MYASPEELLSAGTTVSPKSDVYSLGVLFFELFNPVSDDVERDRALQALRHRILPPHVLQVRRWQGNLSCVKLGFCGGGDRCSVFPWEILNKVCDLFNSHNISAITCSILCGEPRSPFLGECASTCQICT